MIPIVKFRTIRSRVVFLLPVLNLIYLVLATVLIYNFTDSFMIILLLPVAILPGLVTVFIYNEKVFKPVCLMTDVSNNIRKDYDEPGINIEKNDEIAGLAVSMNRMIDSLVFQLNQQERCSDIIETMVSSIDLEEFSGMILKSIVAATGSGMGTFYILSRDGDEFIHLNSTGFSSKSIDGFYAGKLEGEFEKALATREIVVTKNLSERSKMKFKAFLGGKLPKEIITIPVIVKNNTAAVISLSTYDEYTEEVLPLLLKIRPFMNTAFSNIISIDEVRRLAGKLKEKNQLLEARGEALEYQTDELQRHSEMFRKQHVEVDIQKHRVEDANKLKSEFLSNMSHELRTPLNSILSLSRLILRQSRERLSRDEIDYIEIIERNGDKLLTLINDILDLSKIEAGKIDLNPKKIGVSYIITMITENLEQTADDKGIKINIVKPDDLPPIITDEARFYQILQNIVGNAVKFTEDGSVIITCSYDFERVHITVEDTGIGIDEEELPFIFDEFRQIDGTLARKFDGTGLGLAIALKSAEMISGEIRVESSRGVGSRFFISLPILWQNGDEKAPVSDNSFINRNKTDPEAYEGSFTACDTSMLPETDKFDESFRIMVIEDDPDNVTTIQAVLESRYETIVAYDGIEGLDMIKKEHPHLVLLDIALPRMSGFDVIKRIKQDESISEIPVIAFTALSMKGDRERILKAGCDDYISKPYNIEYLLDKIEQWLKVNNG